MVGGMFKLAPGKRADDTSMALCLADSLQAKGGVEQRDLMDLDSDIRNPSWASHSAGRLGRDGTQSSARYH